jgi:hypothetical protein
MTKYFFLLLLVLVSCMDDKKSPEAALKDFIESRFGNVVTRDFIMERVTGKMKVSLENISPADFEKFLDMRSVKRDSFKIHSQSCQEKTCFVTYSISYQTRPEEKTLFNSEVKKIAELVQVEGKWLIADVSNIKTYHEALEPISPLE